MADNHYSSKRRYDDASPPPRRTGFSSGLPPTSPPTGEARALPSYNSMPLRRSAPTSTTATMTSVLEWVPCAAATLALASASRPQPVMAEMEAMMEPDAEGQPTMSTTKIVHMVLSQINATSKFLKNVGLHSTTPNSARAPNNKLLRNSLRRRDEEQLNFVLLCAMY